MLTLNGVKTNSLIRGVIGFICMALQKNLFILPVAERWLFSRDWFHDPTTNKFSQRRTVATIVLFLYAFALIPYFTFISLPYKEWWRKEECVLTLDEAWKQDANVCDFFGSEKFIGCHKWCTEIEESS